MEELKQSILKTIGDNDYKLEDLLTLLDPVSKYVNNETFLKDLGQIAQVIVEDRDGNNTFTVDDLRLIQHDVVAISSIVNGLLLVFGALPDIKLQYNSGATEELIFKLLAYIFLVVVPKEAKTELSIDDKKAVLDIILIMYEVFLSSKAVKNIIKKVSDWFKNKGWCKCICGTAENVDDNDKAEVVEDKLEVIKEELRNSIKNTIDEAAVKPSV